MEAELEFYFNMMNDRPSPAFVPDERAVEHDGRLWNVDTGMLVGTCFVVGFRKAARRTYSRYSRRSRFMTHLWDHFSHPSSQEPIMTLFDKVLLKWKKTRTTIPRLYFLNVRCLLFFICERLNIPPPFSKASCLRDVRRFTTQQNIFNNLCDCK